MIATILTGKRGWTSACFNVLTLLTLLALINVQLSTARAQSITFTNPTPGGNDQFGNAVAAVGTDKVLIGAQGDNTSAIDTGTAYLFSINGTLLTIFTNPTPTPSDFFGNAVAAAGTDKVLIGAYRDNTGAVDAGAAYLFSTNGTLLTTFTNPTPATSDNFGNAVAAVGADRALIGAYSDDTDFVNSGAAYLFSTNGTLLTTFTNPTPASGDSFGYAVAAVGPDKVLIGAFGDSTGATNAGAVYLFSTNGTLLTTFTNPTPASGDSFGYAVAAVGTDKMLIGAYGKSTGATNAGAAYLFSTNGTLLTTFTNPTPVTDGRFGNAVAAVGTDKMLIGAYGESTGATNAGAVYIFSTNGTLLTTFTNPTPATGDQFGYAVAVAGDRVLIGAYQDDTDFVNSGVAYLLNVPPFITTQPQSQTVNAGSNATFTVLATGTAPLSYQWQFNATNIAGATATNYTRTNVQSADAGNYSVVVTNLAGSLTSSNAVLTVNDVPPSIAAQPQNQSVPPGKNATFTVVVTGTAPLSYQWQFNLVNLPGGTNSTYSITNVQSANLGYYRVIVSNSLGSVTSIEAALSLSVSVFADDFESGTLSNWWVYAATPMGISTFTNSVPGNGLYAAVFTNNLSRMHRNIIADNGGSELSGHSRVTFWLFQTNTTTRSFCEVRGYLGGTGGTNVDGGMASPDGNLDQLLAAGIFNTVTLPGEIHTVTKYQGRIRLNTNSEIYWFNLNGSGSPNRSAGWHKFQIERMSDEAIVKYYVDDILCRSFTNAAVQSWDSLVMGGGLSVSTNGLVDGWLLERFDDLPVITSQPASRTNAPGTTATFDVVATGSSLTYQWRKNGANLGNGGNVSGADSATLTLSNVQTSAQGDYTVVVISSVGPTTSSNATLTVNAAATAPALSAPMYLGNNGFQFQVSGAPGVNYVVQASTNLVTTNWVSLSTNVAPFTFVDSSASNYVQRFYRAVYLP